MSVSCDFLAHNPTCVLPEITMDVLLKVRTKSGEHTFREDIYMRTLKYRRWNNELRPFCSLKRRVANIFQTSRMLGSIVSCLCRSSLWGQSAFTSEWRGGVNWQSYLVELKIWKIVAVVVMAVCFCWGGPSAFGICILIYTGISLYLLFSWLFWMGSHWQHWKA